MAKVERVCETCGVTFLVSPSYGKGRFCSKECYWLQSGGPVERACMSCGLTFTAERNQVANGKAKFCSRACHGAWNSIHKRGKAHPNWRGGPVALVCEWCGSTFMVKVALAKRGHKYCSKGCADEARVGQFTGKNSPTWKGGTEERKCETCGKLFYRYKVHIRSPTHGRFCFFQCSGVWLSEHKRGENSSLWRGGRTLYPAGWTESHKQIIRERDGFKCLFCGKTTDDNGRALDVHHIDYEKENLRPGNLVALCRSCHTKTGYKRKFWMGVFAYKGRTPKQDWQHRRVIV